MAGEDPVLVVDPLSLEVVLRIGRGHGAGAGGGDSLTLRAKDWLDF